ncbi:MAG: RNA polymerase sigma factor RpoD/SigA [Treponema sp.]|jgi:RNA polymerase primary sigma factor|nr:RNA polymerase sigma factor RpoD/SigA [Treponema sp.]
MPTRNASQITRLGQKSDFRTDENILNLYLKEINRIPLLSKEEEDRIARMAVSGNEAARNQLVRANLRFVVNIAKKYQGQGIPLIDLISEGNIGLFKAIPHYNADKGFHFISYAVWWIRQAVLKAISEKSRMIRLPANRVNELVQIEKVRKSMSETRTEAQENRMIAESLHMKPQKVERLVAISKEPVSLEKSFETENGKGETAFSESVVDHRQKTPEENALHAAFMADLEAALDTLKTKEAVILRHHYGLGANKLMSLGELGLQLNMSKERVRQIENRAIKRLRHPSRSRKLKCYAA